MNDWLLSLIVIPPLALVACILLPSSWADQHRLYVRRWVTWLLAGQAMLAGIYAVNFLWSGGGAITPVFYAAGDLPLSLSLYYDGLSGLMFLLVSFVGWVVSHFSLRYLAGQATQGRYYRWTAVTVGAVSLLVLSGNALCFVAFWMLTSVGLHQLLIYYPERPEARRVARTKFTISRMGDLFLLTALGLTYAKFGTFEFAELFAAAQQLALSGATVDPQLTLLAWVLVSGAAIKSAQFPFHTWLPNSIETPTPVSALMHAGVVNAGGFLVIRWSPIISLAPSALTGLAIVGAVTASLAGLIMLTQNSQKRALAYSTIAQMGFMLLQCGLGAFSAATLHLVAHSLYKAFAFLNNGSVLEQRIARSAAQVTQLPLWRQAAQMAIATVLVVTVYLTVMLALGLGPATKPGGFALGFIFCLAMTYWLGRSWETRHAAVRVVSVLITTAVTFSYAASYWMVDQVVTSNPLMVTSVPLAWPVLVAVVVAFGSVLTLQLLIARLRRPAWVDALYVHVSNGFYIDAVIRRVFTGLLTS